MKERPIPFRGDRVRAILDGRKTQDRRVIKPQPTTLNELPRHIIWREGLFDLQTYPANSTIFQYCPFGKVGDRLWVRETGAEITGTIDPGIDAIIDGYFYKATYQGLGKDPKWKPSIFMPREASRITLEVTGVKVERLQDISNIDALEEGIETGPMETDPFSKETLPTYKIYGEVDRFIWTSPAVSFKSLWRSINGPDSWEVNPWVWVVEFEVVSTTGRANVKEVQA